MAVTWVLVVSITDIWSLRSYLTKATNEWLTSHPTVYEEDTDEHGKTRIFWLNVKEIRENLCESVSQQKISLKCQVARVANTRLYP